MKQTTSKSSISSPTKSVIKTTTGKASAQNSSIYVDCEVHVVRKTSSGLPDGTSPPLVCTVIVDSSATMVGDCTIALQDVTIEQWGADQFIVTAIVTTDNGPLRYRVDGGPWQSSNVFNITSPVLTTYFFEVEDYFECGVSFSLVLPVPQEGVDTIAPVTYPAVISVTDKTTGSFRLNFAQANDNVTPQAELLYKVYLTEQAPLETLADIDSFGLLYKQAVGVNFFDITNQPADAALFYNITVEDAAGNRFLYMGNVEVLLFEESYFLITSGNVLLEVGETSQLVVENGVIGASPTDIEYSSSHPDRVSVSSTGLMTALSSGTATITATSTIDPTYSDSITADAFVVAGPPPVLEIINVTVSPNPGAMQVGDYLQFTATVGAINGTPTGVTWASSDTNLVTIDPVTGLAYAVAQGTPQIIATSKDDITKSGAANVNISPALTSTDSVAGDLAALTALYNATNGANWTNNTGWLVGNPSNSWYGITVNGAGRVTNLDLFGNNLVGVLPNELGNLKWCDKFDVKHNFLTGQLPAGIGQMSRVRWLLLAGCDPATSVSQIKDGPSDYHPGKARHQTETNTFEGSVLPPEWGQLPMIEIIELSQCLVSGSLPSEWGGVNGMNTIQKLYLNGYRQDHANGIQRGFLSGPLPASWSSFVNLTAITLNRQLDLTGPLPASWSAWTNMRHFRLNHLRLLEGTSIPPEWETWSEIRLFAMSSCRLGGVLPAWLLDDRSPKINTMDLSYNYHTSLGNVNLAAVEKTGPQYWTINWNRITDDFPNYTKRFKNMQLISFEGRSAVYDNNLTGPMDDDYFVGWNRLRNITLSGQPIGGTLPSSFGNSVSSASTQRLGFNVCGFVGKIPATWANYLTNGTYWLYLHGNDLEGIVPAGLSDWKSRTTWNVTVDTSTNRINHTDNPFINGNILYFESTGSNPGGLLANTKYYIVNRTASHYQVSLTEGGSPVNITSVGSGTISVRKNAWRADQNGLTLHSNRFTYADLMPVINAWPTNVPLTYQTQKEFPVNDYQNPAYARTTGQTATFDLSGIHVAGNVYQWRKDGVNLNTGGRIIGATSNILQITNVGISDNGLYTLRITNLNAPQLAESISQPITLTVT